MAQSKEHDAYPESVLSLLEGEPDWGLLLDSDFLGSLAELCQRLPLSSAFEEAELLGSLWAKADTRERALLLVMLAEERDSIIIKAKNAGANKRSGEKRAVWKTRETRKAILEADDRIKAEGPVARHAQARLILNDLDIPGNPADGDVTSHIRKVLEEAGRRIPPT